MSKQLVVIGAGMGGLSAAIHGRLAGYDVLVLEKSASAGGKAAGIKLGDYCLDPGPSIIILPHLYEEVFRAAGRKMSDYLRFRRLATVSRVFFDDEQVFDLPSDEDEALRLLHDICPEDADALRTLLNKLGNVEPLLYKTVYDHAFTNKSQLLDLNLLRFGMVLNPTQTYKDQVDRLFRSALMRAFFYGFPSYNGQTYFAKSPGAFLIPYYMLRDGVYFPDGGVRAIPKAFERLAQELGVEFRFNVTVTSVAGDDRWMRTVMLETGERIEADVFVSNIDRFTFSAWKGEPVTSEPSFSYFTSHWGVRKSFPQLEHHNLFIPTGFENGFRELYGQGQFPREPIVYLNSTSALDSQAAPTGASNIFAVVTSPAKTSRTDWAESENEFKQRIVHAFSSRGVSWEDQDIDFVRVQSPEYFESVHGNYKGSLYGLQEEHRQWGMFPTANTDKRWANLTYSGGSVQPGAGLPMVTLSGKFAIRLLKPRP